MTKRKPILVQFMLQDVWQVEESLGVHLFLSKSGNLLTKFWETFFENSKLPKKYENFDELHKFIILKE